jgi:hypothetical protein
LIARSIEAFGFTNPILIDGEKGIIAGEGRFRAAQKLYLAEVPTIELSWLTPAERQAYVIADNQTAIAGAGWDAEMLRLELGDLKELGFDLTLTGFDEIQLGSFLTDKTAGLTDPDDVPAVPEHPATQRGDLWLLGRHRLLCGDSAVATDVERVLGGVAPHLMVTDRLMVLITIRVGERAPRRTAFRINAQWEGSRTTPSLIGLEHGRYSPAKWPTSGTGIFKLQLCSTH